MSLALRGVMVLGVAVVAAMGAAAQVEDLSSASSSLVSLTADGGRSVSEVRARRFLGGRGVVRGQAEVGGGVGSTSGSSSGGSAALAMGVARRQHAEMVAARQSLGLVDSPLSAAWQAVGPASVGSLAYGLVSGRVTAVALDPADATGNTVYVGSTGGGVWKSVNAAGAAGAVSFVPITDTLPAFGANAGSGAIPSLSIGALSVQDGVVLAGTGDANDATDSYYGGGILRSADGGQTWTLIDGSRDGTGGNHTFVGLGFAGFAWSSETQGLAVAAVSQAAEGTLVNAGVASSQVTGLYYSTDAGVTWQMATVMDGSQVIQGPLFTNTRGGIAATAVVWNPVRKRFFGALRYHGYYESADGVNWTRLAAQPGSGLAGAACLSGNTSCPMFRGALAVEPVGGDTFALTVDRSNLDQGLWQDVCAKGGGGCAGAVAFGTRLGGAALEVGNGSAEILQGDYNLSLAAVSVAATGGGVANTELYVGTEDLYRCSLAAGCVLRNTTNATDAVARCAGLGKVAPAQHAIAVLAAAGSPVVFLGNDGGLWRSPDGVNVQGTDCSADDAAHFENLNGGLGSLAEVVSFAQHPTDPGQLLVGLGVNGMAGTGSAGSSAWPQLSAGEGGVVAIDPANPMLWYGSTGAGVSVKACVSGSACTAADFTGAATIGVAQVGGDASLIDAPWMLDPLAPEKMLVGTCRVWRGPAADGGTWSSGSAISPKLAGATGSACMGSDAMVRSLGAGGVADSGSGAGGSQVLYAGMAGAMDGGGSAGGHLYSTATGGVADAMTAWTDLARSPVLNDAGSPFNPGGFDVSSVVVDSHDATGKTVYATVMGFSGNGKKAPHLYQSTDGGAHWVNISSNLPNAPASSVVVDPNDANTLYVALDTGVYVTTQVASCSTTNCWSVFGVGLPNSPVTQLAVAVNMPIGGGTGELRAGTYGRGIWQIPLVTAILAQTTMSVAPSSLSFPAQGVGTASAAQTVTVTNTGSAALQVSRVAVTTNGLGASDFHATDTCVGASVAVGGTCAVQVSFQPGATGARSGVLTVYGNVAGGQATVSLAGEGTAAGAIVLDPVTLSFGATTVGATSAGQDVTISNVSGVPLALGAISVSGDFVLAANTCGSSLGIESGCTVRIAFRPTASGVRSGVLTVVDDVGTQTAALSGTGTSPATDGLSPLSLNFAAQTLNTTSAAQQVTLTNVGDVALTLIGVETGGDFTAVNGCGNSLNAHSSCAIVVRFVPKDVGARSGVLTVSDQFRSQTVALSGVGVAPAGVSLAPFGTMVFGAAGVGTRSVAQSVTLTNNSQAELRIAKIEVTGDFVVADGGAPCGSTVVVGAACSLQVSFAPTVGGLRIGTLTVTDDASSSPQTLALRGSGVDFSLAANGSTSVTAASGKNAVFPLLLSSAADVVGTANFKCTGIPANATCVASPASVPLGGVTTVSVTVNTGVAATTGSLGLGRRPWVWLVWLMPVGLVLRRGRRLAGLGLLCLLAGCGAGRQIPTDGSGAGTSGPGTPGGSYTVVVSAECAGLTRSVNLTLVVQ
ncbi:choice-of-anchor D domain-containing protein [Granulicella sp. dw_53]|uniref:choice-of-anchor D domain-containing protein n=1 Tax=Granulicella sp. dw_53 TaxID=2719792 RepID=UPI0021059898|nr:choice-of-anchor D domain-containing protein [Granulicella sp. dw_53]